MDASPAHAAPDPLEELYRECMDPLLERARVWFPTLRGCEHDLYQAAWASLLGNRRPVEDPRKFLEVALYSAGLEELRRRRRRPVVSLSIARFKGGGGRRGAGREGVEGLVDRTALLPEEQMESCEDARLLAELLEELTPLQRRIVKLRWGCGVPRREAAALLGISERSLKREVEKAGPVIAANVELASAGRWCERKRSLVIAYCLGLLGPGRGARAKRHLERCPACRSAAVAVRRRLEGVAAALPFPAFANAPSAHEIVASGVGLGDSARDGLAHLGAGVKQHALALFARAPGGDGAASQVAVGGGLRGGGSAVAALAACVVAGGGATYCAVEGVPSAVRDVAGIEQTQKPKDERPSANADGSNGDTAPTPAQAPASTQSGQVPAPQPPTESNPPDSTHEASAPASPAPPNSAEFAPAPAAAASRAPAPAPKEGGGEFGP